MYKKMIAVTVVSLLACTNANAINAKYREQLERSGCTQTSELEGCDINKTKAENAKAGFVAPASVEKEPGSAQTPYYGKWIAKNASGETIAMIQINAKERVLLNGKKVKAKRSDGALIFKSGHIIYVIQGDRRLKNEDYWTDSETGTKGLIVAE